MCGYMCVSICVYICIYVCLYDVRIYLCIYIYMSVLTSCGSIWSSLLSKRILTVFDMTNLVERADFTPSAESCVHINSPAVAV
jgi:hypothetical protein